MNRLALLFTAALAAGPAGCGKKPDPAPPVAVSPVEAPPAGPSTAPAAAPVVVLPKYWHAKPDPAADKPAAWPADWKPTVPLPAGMAQVVNPLVFAADGGLFVAVCEPRAVTVYDLRDGKKVGAVTGWDLTHIGLSRDGATLAGIVPPAPTNAFQKSLYTFDVAADKELAKLTGPTDYVFAGADAMIVRGSYHREANVRVVDRKTGTERGKLPDALGEARWAVSPGGAYVAAVTGEGVTVYATADGKDVGQIKRRQDPMNTSIDALAFSPDGSALAALSDSRADSRFTVWSMATGGRTTVPAVKTSSVAMAQNFEWLPDGTGWLVGGSHVFDRETGQVIWEHPRGFGDDRLPRRAVTVETIIHAPSAGRGKVPTALALATAPPEKVAAVRAVLKAGGTLEDVGRPPLTAVDAEKLAAVTAPPAGVPWTPLDAAPAAVAPPAKPVPLNRPLAEIEKLFVVGGRAVVLTTGPTRQFEATDLATGKVTGSVKVPPGLKAVAVSADGTLAVTLDQATRRRVDVWSLATQAHVAGWRPAASSAEVRFANPAAVFYAGFAGPVLVTMTVNGDFVGWDPAMATPMYRAALPRFIPLAVSPGGKYVLGQQVLGEQDLVLRAVDATTGAVVGDLEPAGVKSGGLPIVAVRPDGQEVAAYFSSQGTAWPQLVRWDAAGRRMAPIATALGPTAFIDQSGVGGDLPAPITYAGPECLLVNQYLHDLTRKNIVWQYGYANGVKLPVRPPAGQMWVATAAKPADPAFLVGTAVPDAVAAKAIAAVAGPADLLAPGAKIAVKVTATGTHADLAPAPILERVQQTLKVRKFEYVARPEDAALVLTFTMTEKPTGKMREFNALGGKTMSVPEIEIFSAAELRAGDAVVWAGPVKKTPFGADPENARVPQTEDEMKAMKYRGLWDRAIRDAGYVGLPMAVAKTADGGATLPGWTTFTPTGLADGPPPTPDRR